MSTNQGLLDQGKFEMIDVAHKPETLRFARSRGWVQLSKKAYDAVAQGQNPKGDVLAMAEVAGLMALKKTAEILPLCHPLAIQHARIRFDLNADLCRVEAESCVQVIGRTGAEMESLMGLQGALMCVYDMSKAVDPLIEIGGIRLLEKRGGKSGHWLHPEVRPENHRSEKKRVPWENIKVSLITLSDRAAQGIYEDKSGAVMKSIFAEWGVKQITTHLLADDMPALKALLLECREWGADMVVCSGGTGLAPRDVTPETILSVCDRLVPGFGELLRSSGSVYTPLAYLSRAQAGLLGQMLVLSLPGSPNAVREGLAALRYVLPTSVYVARGGNPHE